MSALELDVRHDRLLELFDRQQEIRTVGSGFEFTEGAVWNPAENYLVFSDIAGNRMYRLDPPGKISVYREPSNMANGNYYDRQMRLVTCEHATSRVVRQEADGAVRPLMTHYDGQELNSPNDIIVCRDGRVVFTDPIYGRREYYGIPREQSQPTCGVYTFVPGEDEAIRLAGDFDQPNGLCVSPDESLLYVNDTVRMHIRCFAFDRKAVREGTVFATVEGEGDGAPDGMKIDEAGNIVCTGPGGLHFFTPEGLCLGVLRTPARVANFTWGDEDLRTLYMCAGSSLLGLRVKCGGRK
jgi:gluconolactonase